VTEEGRVSYGPLGADLSHGCLVIPHRPELNLGNGLTVEFEFVADDIGEMPVLIANGAWQTDGWFVQILGGQLMVRAAGGDALGPRIEAGQPYAVRFVYDGLEFQMTVNGEAVPQQALAVRDVPASCDLTLGQYVVREPRYQFRGRLRNVKITPDALVE
jgi:hypothetical protein